MHGYEVMQALEERSGGWYKASPGSVYPTLQMLEDQGLVSCREEDGKRVYAITDEGREYVVELEAGRQPPAPWVNVMANADFGTLVSESGAGYTWRVNSQRNRLTEWSNDAVVDAPSEAVFLRDESTGEFWTLTSAPVSEGGPYRVRHGAGYSVFSHNGHGIEGEMTVFVPVDEDGGLPVRVSLLRLRNAGRSARHLSNTCGQRGL